LAAYLTPKERVIRSIRRRLHPVRVASEGSVNRTRLLATGAAWRLSRRPAPPPPLWASRQTYPMLGRQPYGSTGELSRFVWRGRDVVVTGTGQVVRGPTWLVGLTNPEPKALYGSTFADYLYGRVGDSWGEDHLDVDGVSALCLHPAALENYGYWMLEMIPRFWLLSATATTFDQILVSPVRRPYERETLARLGIDVDRQGDVVELAQDGLASCDELVTTTPSSYFQHSPEVVDFLRGLFADVRSSAGGRRLYIRRGDTPRRQLVNEDELIERLGEYGVEPITPDQRTVAEQAALFSAADLVVSPHGAALANLAFCRPGATVLEIHSPAWQPSFWNMYGELAVTAGLRHETVGGAAVTADIDGPFRMDADVVVAKVGALTTRV
jgi:capsular polysaccharide biosynthesis protein